MSLDAAIRRLNTLIAEATRSDALKEQLLSKNNYFLLRNRGFDYEIVEALSQIRAGDVETFSRRALPIIENIYKRRELESYEVIIERTLLSANFSNEFVFMFNRLINPNLGRQNDVMRAYFSGDINFRDVADYTDALNRLIVNTIIVNNLQSQFLTKITENTQAIDLAEFKRPASGEPYFSWIIEGAFGEIGEIITGYIIITAVQNLSRVAKAALAGVFATNSQNLSIPDNVIILPDNTTIPIDRTNSYELRPVRNLLLNEHQLQQEKLSEPLQRLNQIMQSHTVSGISVNGIAQFGVQNIREQFRHD